MTSAQLADALIADVVDMNSTLYERMFDDELLADSPRADLDVGFRRILEIYRGLTDEQRQHLIQHFRQISADTISNFLGVIDGSSSLTGFTGSYELRYDGATVGGGDLQDVFLERTETSS